MTKTHHIHDWDVWVEICAAGDDDPWETDEIGYDLGGGDSETFGFVGERPERKEER